MRVLLIGLLIFILSGAAGLDSTPWCGSYDLNPEHYEQNNHHSNVFVTLDSTYMKEFDGYLACYVTGGWKNDPHSIHDHSYIVNGHTLYLKCWYRGMYNVLNLEDIVIGHFNVDYTELKIDNKMLIKVSNDKISIPGSPGMK